MEKRSLEEFTESRNALREYVHYWRKFDSRFTDDIVVIFDGVINYQFRNKERSIITRTHLAYETGKIWIMPKYWLNTDEYYTEFDPWWQAISVEAGHTLRIVGTGPKLGLYRVDISPG